MFLVLLVAPLKRPSGVRTTALDTMPLRVIQTSVLMTMTLESRVSITMFPFVCSCSSILH